MNISVFIFGHKHLTTIKMAKAKKEGKKKRSRKSVLKTLKDGARIGGASASLVSDTQAQR